ncbi:arginyltransferase [Myxococcaceae bacterium GXIMD 01537]
MARELAHEFDPPTPCSYLPERLATMEQRVLEDVTPEEYEAMLVRGWRRFGPVYFRPACATCQECVSLRVPTATFRPSDSQRRALAACAHFRVEVGPPRMDPARMALYRAWHAEREQSREWKPSPIDGRDYFFQFAFPHPSVREVAYYDDTAEGGPRLVGVGICDETPQAWSAVYFFYDPAYAKCSPGVANVVFQVELARMRGIPHVYLGYRVLECASLRYKGNYRPHELLDGRPEPDEAPRWQPADLPLGSRR